MNHELHARAEKLIAQDRVEGISSSERDWLAAHLRECPSCAQVAQQTNAALRALRAMPVPLPRGLAERTQFRVQLRAQELREQEPKRRFLWVMCGTGAPRLALEFGFGLWWAIPALFAAAIVVLENVRQANERDSSGR
jgi:hypothetical protein